MKILLNITDKDITGSEKLSSAKPRIAADAFLIDEHGDIALSYMGKHELYTLPGGGVEPGESFRETIKREMWEEAGCDCEILAELGKVTENRFEHDFTQERTYFVARVVGEKGSLHLTDEEIAKDTSVVWLQPDKALQLISEKNHDNYQQSFIQKRDVAALTEGLQWLRLHENMQKKIPSWYLKNFYIQYIDGLPFKLKSSFDFSFLQKYGQVFKVLDDQDSGNICFGTKTDDGKRFFVKFAGAPTDRSNISEKEAVANLKRTVSIYQDLTHPNLVKFLYAEEIGGGFAMIFEWIDADCMSRMYPLSYKKFEQLSTEEMRQIFQEILHFQAHVSKKGYVAIDFYDGSIMYDFQNKKTFICDIDFFEKKPYINNMGRLWGSTRFMSPEEFTLGSEIDEITNVYTMGATAFCLFSG